MLTMCADEQQIQTHDAACSTIVAFAEDKLLYPAGVEIMSRTYPGNARYPFLVREIELFRPRFWSKLAEVPVIMKERIYPVSNLGLSMRMGR